MANYINYDLVRFIIFSLSILTLSTFFYLLGRRHSAVKTPRHQSYPFLRHLTGFLRNRHRRRHHDWHTDTLTTTPSLTLHVTTSLDLSHHIATADPTNLRHILVENFPNYIKNSRHTTAMEELLSTGFLNSNSNLWSSHRRIATHEFRSKSFLTFVFDIIQSQITNSLIPRLLSNNDQTVDLNQILQRFVFDNICNVAFGLRSHSIDSNYHSFVNAFDTAVQHTSSRIMSQLPVIWKLKRYFKIGNERKFKHAIETVNRFVMDVIQWKETPNGNSYVNDPDLLSRYMVSSSGIGFEDEERKKYLRDVIINFIFAVKISTSNALSWLFWLLDGHPHCKQLIRKEFAMLMNRSDQIHHLNLTFDELNSLNYLQAAISESMRLFPPVPMISRQALDDDLLPDGTYVERGWVVDCSVYAMGRMERIWGSDCREFRPERWLDSNGVYKPMDSYKYPVFGSGFRMCLGKEMAYMQMRAVVVAVMHAFEIEVVGGGGLPERMADPPYSVSNVLSMKNGLRVRLKKRQESVGSRVKDRGVIVTLFGVVLVCLSFYKHNQNKTRLVTC